MNKNMENLVVVIPVHEFNDEVGKLLTNAINSVQENIEVRVSCKKGLENKIKKYLKDWSDIKIIANEKSDFASLVNNGIKNSKYFSILEYDDEYTPIWFNNVEKYIESMPDVSVFIPLTDIVDFNTKKFSGCGNEAPWASAFSNNIGFIDNDCLQNFFDFYMTGSVFNTDDWNEVGGLKPSIKLTFWYEYMLRATNKDQKIFVVPKVGYNHYMGRKDSLTENYRNNMSKEEQEFWFKLAKKEYFFKEDRNKTFENQTETEYNVEEENKD
jgi:hypothetical protein